MSPTLETLAIIALVIFIAPVVISLGLFVAGLVMSLLAFVWQAFFGRG